MQRLGPKTAEDASVGKTCAACDKPFKEGDYTTFVVLGPGDDPNEQIKCRMGMTYDGVAVEVHFACATGERP